MGNWYAWLKVSEIEVICFFLFLRRCIDLQYPDGFNLKSNSKTLTLLIKSQSGATPPALHKSKSRLS